MRKSVDATYGEIHYIEIGHTTMDAVMSVGMNDKLF